MALPQYVPGVVISWVGTDDHTAELFNVKLANNKGLHILCTIGPHGIFLRKDIESPGKVQQGIVQSVHHVTVIAVDFWGVQHAQF